MGIKGFSKVFPEQKEITFVNMKGKRIAIDVMAIMYKSIMGNFTLTNKAGRITNHITTCVSLMLKLKSYNIGQVWVFDYDKRESECKTFHNPLKKEEVALRTRKRTKALAEAAKLREQIKLIKASKPKTEEEIMFSSDDENDTKALEEKLHKKEKATSRVEPWMLDDIIIILNFLNIKWVMAPKGYEGECIASRLTQDDVDIVDAVFSPDSDVPLFGAKIFIRDVPRKKKLAYYDLDVLKNTHSITQSELIVAGVVLGSDFYHDKEKKLFRGIGPKKVIQFAKNIHPKLNFNTHEKKMPDGTIIKVSEDTDVINAIRHFSQRCQVGELIIHNEKKISFNDPTYVEVLIDWLHNEHDFDKKKMTARFAKTLKV
jgi:5'-3' exonuclease